MTKTVKINGMMCGGCVRRVENALGAIDGVKVSVSLEKGEAVVDSATDIDDAVLKEAVEALGFDVVSIK